MNEFNEPNRHHNRRDFKVKKRGMFKKTSALLAFLMIVSILTPVLAFAAVGFKDVKYHGQKVRGTLYTDRDESVQKSVYVDIYDPSGNKITTATAQGRSVGDYVYYDFSEKVGKYEYVKLFSNVMDSLYETVYRHPAKPDKPEKPGKPE